VQNVVASRAQTLYALRRLLRAHGLGDAALQTLYQAVVVARLLYAASAWWGFTMAADKHRIEGCLRRGVRTGYSRANQPTAAQLVEDLDDRLFDQVRYKPNSITLACSEPVRSWFGASSELVWRRLRTGSEHASDQIPLH